MPKRNIIIAGIIVLVTLMTLQISMSVGRAPEYSLFDPLVDVCDLIHNQYVSSVEDKDLVTGAINGMLHELDPYSEYIPADEVSDFQKRTSGNYEGIGIGIDIQQGYLTVISPFEDSPAYHAGVMSGDRIIEVNGESTKGWSSTRAVKSLTGPAGTDVTLKLLRADGSESTVTITRKQIHVPTVRGWRRNSIDGAWDFMLDNDARVGYVRITQFTGDTADELDQAVLPLLERDLQAMVLDLRSNPGGLMSAAVDVVDRMIDHGVVVSTRGQHTTGESQSAQPDNTYRRFHLVVLVDQGSASASEIVAGALQDHNRAVIVGKRSWGKGSVQRLIRLPDSGAVLKLTTDHYYLPKGRCVHRLPDAEIWGVDPDIEEALDPNSLLQLRNLMDELTNQPLSNLQRKTTLQIDTAPATPAITTAEQTDDPVLKRDLQQKQKLAQKLITLDNQLGQAYKQCKGLLRARPSLQGLTDAINQ